MKRLKNVGLWIAIGIAIGAGVGTTLMQQGSEKDQDDKPDKGSQHGI